MAILKYKDIKNLSLKDLESKFKDLKKELIKSKSQVSGGSAPENPGRIKEIKRTISKILTYKNQGGMSKKQ